MAPHGWHDTGNSRSSAADARVLAALTRIAFWMSLMFAPEPVPEVFGEAVLHVGWGRWLDKVVIDASAGLSCLYPHVTDIQLEPIRSQATPGTGGAPGIVADDVVGRRATAAQDQHRNQASPAQPPLKIADGLQASHLSHPAVLDTYTARDP